MELIDELQRALDKYFLTLKNKGQVPLESKKQLWLLWMIREILTNIVITEEDYRTIGNVLQCLYGTCLVDYPDYSQHLLASAISDVLNDSPWRITQNEILRVSQKPDFRRAL